MRANRLLSYENGLIALLGITIGIVFSERFAINLLMPFIVTDLHLSNLQAGALGSAVSLTWAAAGYVAGRTADARGGRKLMLVACVASFGVLSCLAGLMGSFIALLAVRLCMGAAGGPVPALAQLFNFEVSSEHRRGLNAGVGGICGGLIVAAAPLGLVSLASHFNWRIAFYLAGIPALVAALICLKFVRDAKPKPTGSRVVPEPAFPHSESVPRARNVWVCSVIATLLLAFGIVGAVFLPLYFIQLRHFSPERMGVMMSAIGVASLVGFVTVPLLSDHFGRKPVVCFFGLLGACAPVASLYWMGSDVVLGMLLFLGNLLTALPALVIGTIPSESVLARGRGAVLGMVMGIAELLGGFMSPIGAGWLADRTSLAAPLFIQIVCALLIAVFATMLWETAPKKVRPAAFVAAKAL